MLLSSNDILDVALDPGCVQLTLSSSALSAAEWTVVIAKIMACPSLTELHLLESTLPADWSTLLQKITSLTITSHQSQLSAQQLLPLTFVASSQLTHLSLQHVFVEAQSCNLIPRLLQAHKKLTSLQLGDIIVRHLVSKMPPKLVTLHLDNVNLTGDGAKMLAQDLGHTKILDLSLANNDLRQDICALFDAEHFARCLAKSSVRKLNLSCCNLHETCLEFFLHLVHGYKPLHEILLFGNFAGITPYWQEQFTKLNWQVQQNAAEFNQMLLTAASRTWNYHPPLRVFVCGLLSAGKSILVHRLKSFCRDLIKSKEKQPPPKESDGKLGLALDTWHPDRKFGRCTIACFAGQAESLLLDPLLYETDPWTCAFVVVVRLRNSWHESRGSLTEAEQAFSNKDSPLRQNVLTELRYNLNVLKGVLDRNSRARSASANRHSEPAKVVVVLSHPDQFVAQLKPKAAVDAALFELKAELSHEFGRWMTMENLLLQDCRKLGNNDPFYRQMCTLAECIRSRDLHDVSQAAEKFNKDCFEKPMMKRLKDKRSMRMNFFTTQFQREYFPLPDTPSEHDFERLEQNALQGLSGLKAAGDILYSPGDTLVPPCRLVTLLWQFFKNEKEPGGRLLTPINDVHQTGGSGFIHAEQLKTWLQGETNIVLAVLIDMGLCIPWPNPKSSMLYAPAWTDHRVDLDEVWQASMGAEKFCGRAIVLELIPSLAEFARVQREFYKLAATSAHHKQLWRRAREAANGLDSPALAEDLGYDTAAEMGSGTCGTVLGNLAAKTRDEGGEPDTKFIVWRLGAAWKAQNLAWEVVLRWPESCEGSRLGNNAIELLMCGRDVVSAGRAWDLMVETTEMIKLMLPVREVKGVANHSLQPHVFEIQNRVREYHVLAVGAHEEDVCAVNRFTDKVRWSTDFFTQEYYGFALNNALISRNDWEADESVLMEKKSGLERRDASSSSLPLGTGEEAAGGVASGDGSGGTSRARQSRSSVSSSSGGASRSGAVPLYMLHIPSRQIQQLVDELRECDFLLSSFHACYNSSLKRAFEGRYDVLCERDSNGLLPTTSGQDPADLALKQAVEKSFWAEAVHTSEPDDGGDPVRIVLAWHGVKSIAVAKRICCQGLISLSKRDKGYFGSGAYFTLDPVYAAHYAAGLIDGTDDGSEHALLLCALLLKRIYVVSRSDYEPGIPNSRLFGQPLSGAVDAHVVRVSEKENFQATRDNSPEDLTEIVVQQEANILPLALVKFSVCPRQQALLL